MTRRPRYAAMQLSEGELLVRGTLDPIEALRILTEDPGACGDFETALEDLPWDYSDGEAKKLSPEETGKQIGDYLFGLLHITRSGYYRKVHCLPNSMGYDEGWSFVLYPAKKGPGAFPAVEFYR